jgi:ketosteroid isomerase-like protein
MTCRAWLAAALLALGAAHGPSAAQTSEPAAAELLARQADAWDKAIVRQDRAAIETNMTEDFRQIDGDGDIEDKTSFVNGLMSPKLRIDPYTVEEFEIRIYGDVALLSGRTRMTGAYDGKPFRSHYRYIDIYVRKDGQWRIASVQITRMRP